VQPLESIGQSLAMARESLEYWRNAYRKSVEVRDNRNANEAVKQILMLENIIVRHEALLARLHDDYKSN
jgi:hypothetical protein